MGFNYNYIYVKLHICIIHFMLISKQNGMKQFPNNLLIFILSQWT